MTARTLYIVVCGAPLAARTADAVVVVPTTFNTLNAWSNGNAYSYPLTVLCVAAEVPWRDEDLLARCLIGIPATPRGPLSVRC
ncbi:hypothetical protein GCM10009745_22050 [Kribbella yunnanensis]|uniref:Flavoprotein domain-containing protein n=1 Tax=Kribbella yunnanensis TaxID=190194 RepID=A0ABN2GWQ7_9ACTN